MWPFRKPAPPSPFLITQGVLNTLEQRATERRDMTAVGKIKAARNLITRESLRGAK